MSEITREQLIALSKEAQHTTAMFAAWSGSLVKQQDNAQSVVYYLKWIDITNNAINHLSSDTPETVKKQMADDLTLLIATPLRGMLKTISIIAEKRQIELPPQDEPKDILAFKRWAVDYINSALGAMKESK